MDLTFPSLCATAKMFSTCRACTERPSTSYFSRHNHVLQQTNAEEFQLTSYPCAAHSYTCVVFICLLQHINKSSSQFIETLKVKTTSLFCADTLTAKRGERTTFRLQLLLHIKKLGCLETPSSLAILGPYRLNTTSLSPYNAGRTLRLDQARCA